MKCEQAFTNPGASPGHKATPVKQTNCTEKDRAGCCLALPLSCAVSAHNLPSKGSCAAKTALPTYAREPPAWNRAAQQRAPVIMRAFCGSPPPALTHHAPALGLPLAAAL